MRSHVVPPCKACTLSRFQSKRLFCLYLQSWQKGPAENNRRLTIVKLLPFILINNISVMLKAHYHKDFYGCRYGFNQPLSFQSSSSVFILSDLSTVPLTSWRVWERQSCRVLNQQNCPHQYAGKKSKERRRNVLYLRILGQIGLKQTMKWKEC